MVHPIDQFEVLIMYFYNSDPIDVIVQYFHDKYDPVDVTTFINRVHNNNSLLFDLLNDL
jgi:hypothetical protein